MPVITPAKDKRRQALLWAAVAAVSVTSLALRLIALDSHPGGLYPDEAAEGNSAVLIAGQPGYHPIFLSEDGGREALFAYLVAAMFRIFGVSVTSLRATSVVLAVLAIPATFAALRRLGGGAALGGATWIAGALWLIVISRDGMRNAIVPVTAALIMWQLLRYSDRPTRSRAFAAGAVGALGMWTYQPLKLTPLLILLWMVWLRHADHERFTAMWRRAGWLTAAYVLVALPMLVVAITNPGAYFGRGLQTSPLNPDNSGAFGVVHLLRVAGMFTVAGDPNARHDAGAIAMLGWPLGLVAVAGAVRAWRLRASVPAASMLLAGMAVFLIPPALAVEGGTPHFLRSLGIAPFLAGLVGLGCVECADGGGRVWSSHGRRLGAGISAAALAGTLAYGVTAYATRPAITWWFAYSANTVQMARAATPADTVISSSYDEMTVRFIDHGRMPHTARPSVALHPAAGTSVYAVTRDQLSAALGPGAGTAAQVAGRDPDGTADVFVVRR